MVQLLYRLTESITVTVGLIIFVTVVGITVLTLLYDGLRFIMGWRTISMNVWRNKWYAVPILLFWAIGGIGLAIHLLYGVDP